MALRIGSWGTPELGITEWLQKTLQPSNTSTLSGGSNLMASSQDYLQAGGKTLTGAPISNPYQGTQAGVLGAATSTGGGGTVQQVPQNTNPNPDPFANQGDAAKSQAQIELEQTLGEYDRYAEEARAQSANLDTQRTSALGSMENTLSRSKAEATTAKADATSATFSAKNKALGTAQDVQRSNRNVLRALGILSSSAAGEMLNKPMNEYGTQAADLEQGLVKRLGVVEDWWLGKQGEFQQAKTDLEAKFTELKGNIDRDLRFNDRQRVTAVKAAGAALQQRLADIQTQSMNYQTAAKQYSDNMLLQLAQMKMYQNPSADVSSIYNTLLSSANAGRQPQQVGIQQTEEQRKKQTLSGY
jgi:hypothetical protein